MNQMKSIKRSVSLFLCVLLLAAAAMVTTGCSDSKNSSSALQQSSSVAQALDSSLGLQVPARRPLPPLR